MHRSVWTLALVLGCGEDVGITRLRVSGAFDPPKLEFGEVPIGLSSMKPVVLENTSQAPFTIEDLDASGAFSARAAAGLLEGLVVSAGERIDVEVSFISLADRQWNESLVVRSGDLVIPLELSARGVFRNTPQFTVDPATLDFGVVEIGSTTQLTVALKNVGNASGQLMGAALASGASDFRIDVPWPITVQQGIIGVFRVMFTPSRPGSFRETMQIQISDGLPPVELGLIGESRDPNGQFLCTPAAITFGSVVRGGSASQSITCTARGGGVQITRSELTMDTQYYVITSEPPPAIPANGAGTYTVEFRPDGLPVPHEASLLIHHQGAAGPTTLAIPVRGEVGVPPPAANAITAILRWDQNFTDIDVHLVRPGGAPFSLAGDCFWASKGPDWGTPNLDADNPFLDVDDIDGFGPETVNMRTAEAGAYRVMAHYYADRGIGASNATMEIYVGGVLQGSYAAAGMRCNDLWDVGTVNWSGGSGSFAPTLSVSPTQNGDCQ
jgi:hypothetical protein